MNPTRILMWVASLAMAILGLVGLIAFTLDFWRGASWKEKTVAVVAIIGAESIFLMPLAIVMGMK